MAVYTDPMALLAKQKRLFDAVQAKAAQEHLKMVRGVEAVVRVGLLSGPLTEKDRYNMGHPYARVRMSRRGFRRESLKGKRTLSTKMRGPNAGAGISVSLLPINAPTGKLRSSGAILRFPPSIPGGQELQIAYRAPYAKYVLAEKGTRSMKPRGFVAAKKQIDKKANRDLGYRIRLIQLTAAATGRV